MIDPADPPAAAKTPLVISIFGAHVERIGLFRTFFGGFAMYLSIPLFVFLHLTVVVFLYRWMLAPLLDLPPLSTRDYFAFDRHQIAGLHWFDKLNCWFCSYANGTIKLMNDELDNLATSRARAPRWAALFVEAYVVVNVALLFALLLWTTVVLNVLAKLLGLHRGSVRRINRRLRQDRYAFRHHPFHRELILYYKAAAEVVAYNLEQIESQWCPLQHLEREGLVLPNHHDRFLERGDLAGMRLVLVAEGTVSLHKPKW